MELWIRSQDKMKLIRIIDLGIFEEQEGYTIYYDDSIDNMLGTYATKERALEVLDEIQSIIKLINAWELDKNSFNVCIKKFGCTEEELVPIMSKMQCYEMPKE